MNEYLMTRATPTLVAYGEDHYAPSAGTAPKAVSKGHDRPQNMDESGREPRRAVAEAVASPLGV
jgi:hypothetical protein